MPKPQQKMVPIAVFDISSSSVAGAHALIPSVRQDADSDTVAILASTRLQSQPKEDIDIERFVAETLSQLDAVIGTLKKADAHTPKSIHALLASPWFVSQTRSITYAKDAPFTCTEKLINTLIEKEIAFVIDHEMGRFGTMGKEGIIIEKQISQIKLNGYTTAKPYGKKAKSLELFLVITVSPKIIIERIKETFSKEYAGVKVRFTTSAYASFIVARDFLKAPSESLIIDIGEEITDIACIKEGLFLYQHSFPVGTYEIYRAVTQTGQSSISEASALVQSFRLGKLSVAMTGTVQKALDDFGASWMRSFQESINASAYAVKLPSQMYIVSDEAFGSFFSTMIKSDPFVLHSVGTVECTPTPLTHDLFISHVTSLDPEHTDGTLLIASLFASRLM